MLLDKIMLLPELAKQSSIIDVLWLYGSYANDTANDRSDIDLAVAYGEMLPDKMERYLRPEQTAMVWREKLQLGDEQLSVVDINQAPVPLAYNIISQSKVIFCRSDLRLRSEEQRVWSLWEHYEYEHQRHRKAL